MSRFDNLTSQIEDTKCVGQLESWSHQAEKGKQKANRLLVVLRKFIHLVVLNPFWTTRETSLLGGD